MWFKVYETYNWEGVSENIYENCIKNRFTNESEYIEGLFHSYYKVKVCFESTHELMEFIECCGSSEVVINKNREIEIYNGYRE